jgi:hypothetical protein
MNAQAAIPALDPEGSAERLAWLRVPILPIAAALVAGAAWLSGQSSITAAALGVCGLALGFRVGIAFLRRCLSAGNNVVGVARAVVEEAVGTRLPVLLVILVVVGLPVLPLVLDPSERLEYRLQFFLNWGLSASGLLLALVTIFLSTSTVCGDIDSQRIHMALVKPIARWQYLAGKWLGIVLLNALLVALVGGGVYATAEALRRLPAADGPDRRAVDEEVMTARSVARPIHPRGDDFEADVAAAIDQFQKDDPSAFAKDPDGARKRIHALQVVQWHTVTPDTVSSFDFVGLDPEKIGASVLQLRLKPFADNFNIDRAPVRFALWLNERPYPVKDGKHEDYELVSGSFHTLEIPTAAIDEQGRLRVTIANKNLVPPGETSPTSVSFSPGKGLELLYRSGSFGGNFLRCLAVMWSKLALIAAAGLAAASWLGFPTAVLAALMIYVTAVARGFLADAIDIYTGADQAGATISDMIKLRGIVLWERLDKLELWEAFKTLTSFVADGFIALIPSFGAHDGVTEVATGRLLSVSSTLVSIGELGILYPLVLLAIGWALLTRRDLVNVSGF